jgi:hypothetical protein
MWPPDAESMAATGLTVPIAALVNSELLDRYDALHRDRGSEHADTQ